MADPILTTDFALDLAQTAIPILITLIRDAVDGDDEALRRLRTILGDEDRLVQIEAARIQRAIERKAAAEAAAADA